MNKKVIIIDDDSISILVSKTMMQKAGFGDQILAFQNPKEAIDHLEVEHDWSQGPPEYIFLDINMPTMTGWEFIEKYKRINDEVFDRENIILLSASVDPDDNKKALDEKVVLRLISKPITKEILKGLQAQ